jgi:YD repeat-containing protein
MPYKATYNYKCLDQTYEIGQEYKMDQKPLICKVGFHYCDRAKDTLTHYDYDSFFKLLEIEDLNPSETIRQHDKSCSNHIRIVREITDPTELLNLLGQHRTFNHQLGKILTQKCISGYFFEYTYNEFGDVLTYKESGGYSYSFTYNQARKVLTYKNSSINSQVSEFSYENTYDKFNGILTHKESTGDSYEYTRDECGRELTYKSSSGYSSECTYNEFGKISTYKNSQGCYRIYTYDKFGNQLTCVNLKNIVE